MGFYATKLGFLPKTVMRGSLGDCFSELTVETMSYTRLRYHLIFATKGRRPCITPEVEPFVYEQLRAEALEVDSKIMLLGGVEDHIHSIAAIHPTLAVSDFVRDVKKQTTKAVRKKFPHLPSFKWAVGFTAYTVNPDDMTDLWSYIETQKEHHANDTLIDKYEYTQPPKPSEESPLVTPSLTEPEQPT